MNMEAPGSPRSQTAQQIAFDTILPAAMALRAEESGVKKASTDPVTLLVLSVLGGAFISFGAVFATAVSSGSIIENRFGGSIMVACVYWLVYLRKKSPAA